MFDAAIFDMDGLLIDSERAIMAAWLGAARDLGVGLDEAAFVQLIGRARPVCDRILTEIFGGQPAFREAVSLVNARLNEHGPEPIFPPKKGALEMLQRLQALGVRCAVASSSSRSEIGHRLGAVGILGFMAAVAGGDEVDAGKPDPAVYNLAAKRLGHHPAHCLAFEDSENGALAALASGARVVLVPDVKRPRADIVERCFHTLASLDEALPHIPTWFPSPNVATGV